MIEHFTNVAAESKTLDLGLSFWTTTIGISVDELFGTNVDDKLTRTISNTMIEAFRLRSLAQPIYNYVPAFGVLKRLGFGASSLFQVLSKSPKNYGPKTTEDRAEKLRKTEVGYGKDLLEQLEGRIAEGDTTPSILGDILRTLPQPLSPNDKFHLVTSLIGTGMSVGTGLTFLVTFLASHPEIQEKAHCAIDDVYGGASPDPFDTDRVEYIKALGLETGRYFCAIRIGFFRETYEDVAFDLNGVAASIPKGTLVAYNSYLINRDPQRYDRPEEFVPERWMNGRYGRTDEKTQKVGAPHLNHGAGRRGCLGVESELDLPTLDF